MLCPLIAGIPAIVCCVKPTCNSFTADDVKADYDSIVKLLEEAGAMREIGVLTGLASDGDERRVKFQLSEIAGRNHGDANTYSAVNHCSFVFLCRLTGRILGIHTQDPLQ